MTPTPLAGRLPAMGRIYLDHNATTPVAPAVREAVLPLLGERFGNPSSGHREGRDARELLDRARRQVAAAFGARPTEVLLVSSGTEAIHTALRGAGGHVVISAIEHSATLQACAGRDATIVGVDARGVWSAEAVLDAVRPDTTLVSLMHANNETGAALPVAAVGRALRERGVPLHVDAVQSAGKLPVSLDVLCCDLISVSGHKIYGLQGAGALLVRHGTPLVPLIPGHQERGRRGGTENLIGAVALGAACAGIEALLQQMTRVEALRDRLQAGVEALGGIVHCGDVPRVANTLSARFEGVDGESLLLHLDLRGIAASSGSACTTGDTRPSHVLLAMGLTPVQAHGALRLSLGVGTTDEDVDAALAVLAEIVPRLREE